MNRELKGVKSRRKIRCKKCGSHIDRGACEQAFTIITIKDDRENDSSKYRQRRFYLCDDCTVDLELFLGDAEAMVN